MKPLVVRRWLGLTLLAAAVLALVLGKRLYALGLHEPAFPTGWILVALLLFLVLLNVRKKLSYLPLGTAAAWTQAHLYLGLLSLVVFALHAGSRLPSGGLEIALATLYTTVALSGLLGIALERRLPARLAQRGEPLIYERIPQLRARLRGEVEQLVEGSLTQTGSATIAEYYRCHLLGFFAGPRNAWRHLLGSDVPDQMLRRDVAAVQRYMSEGERAVMCQIEALVLAKNELDFHHASYLMLKSWLFLHIPLSYALLPLILLHVVLVYAFGAGS